MRRISGKIWGEWFHFVGIYDRLLTCVNESCLIWKAGEDCEESFVVCFGAVPGSFVRRV